MQVYHCDREVETPSYEFHVPFFVNWSSPEPGMDPDNIKTTRSKINRTVSADIYYTMFQA